MKEQVDQFLKYLTVEKEYSSNTLAAYRNDLSSSRHFYSPVLTTGVK